MLLLLRFLGQSEVFISVKKQLDYCQRNECIHYVHLQCLPFQCLSLDKYMVLLKPQYVVTALVLNLFGGFIIASIINPYEVTEEEDMLEVQEEEKRLSLKY